MLSDTANVPHWYIYGCTFNGEYYSFYIATRKEAQGTKEETAIYHVLVRAISDLSLFTDEEDTQFYTDILNDLQHKGYCGVYAYALFPTHVHILLKDSSLSPSGEQVVGLYWISRKEPNASQTPNSSPSSNRTTPSPTSASSSSAKPKSKKPKGDTTRLVPELVELALANCETDRRVRMMRSTRDSRTVKV